MSDTTEIHADEFKMVYPLTYDVIYNRGRTDAIDEFVSKVSETILWDILAEIMKRNINASEGADRIIEYLEKIAEQIKEQTNV